MADIRVRVGQENATSETNFVLSTNNEGMPAWANIINGGEY